MYVQLATVAFDCSAEAKELQLAVPANVGPRSSVVVALRNEGSADAWLKVGSDTLKTALTAAADGVARSFGPYRADSLPVLEGELGANCVVTLLVEGR